MIILSHEISHKAKHPGRHSIL